MLKNLKLRSGLELNCPVYIRKLALIIANIDLQNMPLSQRVFENIRDYEGKISCSGLFIKPILASINDVIEIVEEDGAIELLESVIVAAHTPDPCQITQDQILGISLIDLFLIISHPRLWQKLRDQSGSNSTTSEPKNIH
ncbi:MAG: hypothetical protein JKY84_02450 [Emcibacteraceae bacterium]|nr:hypothetical protein [Emcibacteraceae bacterium]